MFERMWFGIFVEPEFSNHTGELCWVVGEVWLSLPELEEFAASVLVLSGSRKAVLSTLTMVVTSAILSCSVS